MEALYTICVGQARDGIWGDFFVEFLGEADTVSDLYYWLTIRDVHPDNDVAFGVFVLLGLCVQLLMMARMRKKHSIVKVQPEADAFEEKIAFDGVNLMVKFCNVYLLEDMPCIVIIMSIETHHNNGKISGAALFSYLMMTANACYVVHKIFTSFLANAIIIDAKKENPSITDAEIAEIKGSTLRASILYNLAAIIILSSLFLGIVVRKYFLWIGFLNYPFLYLAHKEFRRWWSHLK